MKKVTLKSHSSDAAVAQQFAGLANDNGVFVTLRPSEKPGKPSLYFPKDCSLGKKQRATLRTILRSLVDLKKMEE